MNELTCAIIKQIIKSAFGLEVKMNSEIANNINILGKFCGIRDINELSQENLLECYEIRQADVMVLFGGSILAGGDVLAEAINNNIAKKYIIVGGAGHTTETLRQIIHQ